MSDRKINQLAKNINNLKEELDNFEIGTDYDEDQNKFDELERQYKKLESELEDINNILQENNDSNSKPLLNKLDEQKQELNILNNNLEKKRNELNSKHSTERLKRGELRGIEKKKAENDLAKDNIKETDNQGKMLHAIHKDIVNANQDLTDASQELSNQGEQINRVGQKVVDMGHDVHKIGLVTSEMERRVCCRKFVLVLGIIILFLVNIIMVFIILAKRFGWYPFNKSSPTPTPTPDTSLVKGIHFGGEGDLNYGDFNEKNLAFVLLQGGESTNSHLDKFKDNLQKAKEKNIKVGAYWLIKSESEDAAKEANEAFNFLRNLETEGKLSDLAYDFYFKFDENNLFLNDYTKIENLCSELQGKKPCGIALSSSKYEYFKNNIDNIQKISSYWVEPNGVFDDANAKKLAFWTTTEKVSISNVEFPVIRSKQ